MVQISEAIHKRYYNSNKENISHPGTIAVSVYVAVHYIGYGSLDIDLSYACLRLGLLNNPLTI